MTIFLLLCNAPTVFSQNRYTITKSFTINNGLPSNNVYRCVQDNKGFLWVATDAGIARFDGKQFQVFTTQHGLPDNEVLEVIKENNGTIWVICFKQSPAYFDEVENRFINANEKKYLQNIYSTSSIYGYPLIKGGMKFITEQGSFIVKNNKLETFLPYKGNFLLLDENGNDKVYWGLRQAYSKNKTVKGILLWVKNDKAIDSFELIKRSPTSNFNYGADGTSFYFNYPAEKYVIVVDSITVNTTMVKRRLLKVAESFFKSSATTNYLAFSSNAGNVHVYNKQNLKFEFTLNGNYIPNTIYEDNSNNIWVCSLDKGLILYKKQTIKQVDLPSSFQNLHFISLALKSNGSILAGNYYGELIEKNKQNFRVYKPTSTKTITRIRKIIFSQNKAFTFSEQGIFVNNKNRITSKKISYVFTNKR
jgi:ligand-binding sensor domain-containing protein